jgi:pimeloyl-ACP methyl ester carboxylesterase
VKRRWKILIALAVALAALLTVNTVVVNQQTKAAGVTIDGGEIMSLPGGEIQVKVDGPTSDEGRPLAAPIVLLHCYACSLEWWDEITPLLATDRRVIRVDFLGFGGSEKPSSGYSVEDQAQLVAGALNKLDVQGAVVVGQSMGSAMAVALAEQSSQLVDRVVDISLAADNEASELPLLARLEYTPVLGQAMWRLTPDFAIKQGFDEAFAPDFEVPDEFEDTIVDGYRAMTYTSFTENNEALEDYRDAEPLDDRMRAAAVPLMAIFGEQDQIVDVPLAEEGLQDVPGVRISTLPDVGHTPQVEAPKETAALIEEFARDAGDEIASEHPPRDAGLGEDKGEKDGASAAKRKQEARKRRRKPDRRGNRQGEGK